MSDKIRGFFEKHIRNLHRQVEKDKTRYLDLEIDKAKESYFVTPQHSEYLYLNNIPFETERELEVYLSQFWKDQPELLELVPDLIKLALILKESQKEQSAELSPYVYAMF